jgi:phage tail sheath protein FI
MPEYLAPGVYVEEVSFRDKSIEGVSTSVAGFIGPTCYGPTEGEPELLTSFADFQRIYGGIDQLTFEDPDSGQGSRLFRQWRKQALCDARVRTTRS